MVALLPVLFIAPVSAESVQAKVTGVVKFEDHGAHGRYISIHPVEQ